MRTRWITAGAAAIVGAVALAACGGGAGESADTPGAPAPAAPVVDAGAAGGTFPAGVPLEASHFVGLPLDAATSFAEELGRQWRIGTQDGEDLALTEDLVPGRVTFTVEDGVVTAATIEAEDEQIVVPPAS